MPPTPDNLFDPAFYADARKPLAAARTLPAWCYTARSFHERELERCFRPHWQFVGHASEVGDPGQYLALDLTFGPTIVMRGGDGQLRAFVNACRHRGARLVNAGGGRCEAIVCPYHSWTYRLDGRLQAAPLMRDVPGFSRDDWSLTPLRLESWQGLMFVSANPKAAALTDYLGDFVDKFACYDFADMVVVRRAEHDVACNWKLLLENALEAYHTGTVHKASLGQQHSLPEETRGNWDALYIPQATSIAVLPGEAAPFPHIPTLVGRPAAGSYFTVVYPNTQFACTQDCMWWLSFHPVDVAKMRLRLGFCFPRRTVALPRFAVDVEPYIRRWTVSVGEDNATGELQQAGLASALRPPGPLAASEFCVHRAYQWLLRQVLDG